MLIFLLRPLDWVRLGAVSAFGLWLLAASPVEADFLLSDQESEVYYRFAVVVGEEIKVDKDCDIVGNLHSNSEIKLKSGSSVTGDVSAVDDVDADGTVSGKSPKVPKRWICRFY